MGFNAGGRGFCSDSEERGSWVRTRGKGQINGCEFFFFLTPTELPPPSTVCCTCLPGRLGAVEQESTPIPVRALPLLPLPLGWHLEEKQRLEGLFTCTSTPLHPGCDYRTPISLHWPCFVCCISNMLKVLCYIIIRGHMVHAYIYIIKACCIFQAVLLKF